MSTVPVRPADRSGETLLVAFLGTVAMLFAGLTAAYLIRRSGPDWRAIELPRLAWANGVALLLASAGAELGARRSSRKWAAAALLLGLAFLAGQVAVWTQLSTAGLGLASTPHAAFYHVLAAVHGLHLAGGIAFLVWAAARGRSLRHCATYWHFLGLAWMYSLALLSISSGIPAAAVLNGVAP